MTMLLILYRSEYSHLDDSVDGWMLPTPEKILMTPVGLSTAKTSNKTLSSISEI